MTRLYLDDAYRRTAPGVVTGLTEQGGVRLDASLFYPTSGGQPGDAGRIVVDGRPIDIATTVLDTGEVVLVPAAGQDLPGVGAEVTQEIDWDRRLRHMRIHTALHLLSVVIPLPVTGGQITAEKGRLDFNMPEAPEDKAALEEALNALIAADHPVSSRWISEAELDANPGLVKTMSVQPPRGAGRIRLVRIGKDGAPVDLQPCGGTHVRSTAEIGPVRLGKIEKKGRMNRRVALHLES
ncbi:alanyl-tRNA editing protein [Oceanomicrobium pacificus]|uniref:Alanyl-tRNA editing protein n=1 Tax=Oceanomicrobium pacificus TaxID=2692916 RepID=A0A6B0U6W0_9RHOB|nr:alanyl-tRNA editing protein [Oceanomicrobium pacificus]MXU66591.1 alanyl-tRNA editing protein [Oceanomicrobium pacificus]